MPRQDTVDFVTAFAVGTVLGIGATLLLQPERTPKERVVRQFKPYRKKMRRSYGHAREAFREGADATGEFSGELVSAGREILGDFRSEVAKILGEAREDLQELVEEQAGQMGRARKRGRKRLGW